MTIARDLLEGLVAALRADQALAQDVREVLGLQPVKAAAPSVLYEPVAAFAARVAVSKRHVWDLRKAGKLVTIGQGRTLRVDVPASLERLRQAQHGRPDDSVERQARASARRAASR